MRVAPVARDSAGEILSLLDEWADACRPAALTVTLPLVDEAEAARLTALADSGEAASGWLAWKAVATSDGRTVGYASMVVATAAQSQSVGELVVDRADPDAAKAGERLLTELAARVAGPAHVWLRQIDGTVASIVMQCGAAIERRLGIMARDVGDEPVSHPASAGTEIRASRGTPADIDGIVAVLAAAYAGTAESGWDRQRFDQHAAGSWFRHDDVLVATRLDGQGAERIVGVHWTKRRSTTVGEVYNLAVTPEASGAGIGGRLLDAGVAHLQSVGCRQVVLWVDLDNTAAVALYEQAGFAIVATDACYLLGG